MKNKLKLSFLLQYGVLAFPLSFAGFPLYILAPDFYATKYGIKLSTLGIALLLLRLFDALQDPLIGMISDRYRSQTLLMMGLAACILVLSMHGLFNLYVVSPLIWFVICISCAVTAYSILTINLNALGALWVEQKKPQTIISGIREGCGLIGLVVAVSLPNLLEKAVPRDEIYHWFSFILLVIMMIAFLNFSIWYHFNTKKFNKKIPHSFLCDLKSFSLESKKLFLIYIASMLASSIPAVLVIFFVRDLLDAEAYTGLFLLLYFLSGVCFLPFWNGMSKKYGKYQSWFFSMLFASISFIWAFLLTKGDLWQYGAICVISGSALGADLLLPPAILADDIHASKAQTSASTHYGVLTLTAKASLALASGLSFFMLDIFDFLPAGRNSEASLMGLSVSYALIPCIMKVGTAFLLWRMFIKSKKGTFYENN